eukprot:TRINITY_DN32330_c0_g1_i1.p1 TRINITY_DN32330_c0_g1~~TRINITY_DN32330_c0_g1_i1.p1  ORF type:complete len:483 (+),score=188.65 TRINITY_DN32330_c0_g1_i1:42-1490(+)
MARPGATWPFLRRFPESEVRAVGVAGEEGLSSAAQLSRALHGDPSRVQALRVLVLLSNQLVIAAVDGTELRRVELRDVTRVYTQPVRGIEGRLCMLLKVPSEYDLLLFFDLSRGGLGSPLFDSCTLGEAFVQQLVEVHALVAQRTPGIGPLKWHRLACDTIALRKVRKGDVVRLCSEELCKSSRLQPEEGRFWGKVDGFADRRPGEDGVSMRCVRIKWRPEANGGRPRLVQLRDPQELAWQDLPEGERVAALLLLDEKDCLCTVQLQPKGAKVEVQVSTAAASAARTYRKAAWKELQPRRAELLDDVSYETESWWDAENGAKPCPQRAVEDRQLVDIAQYAQFADRSVARMKASCAVCKVRDEQCDQLHVLLAEMCWRKRRAAEQRVRREELKRRSHDLEAENARLQRLIDAYTKQTAMLLGRAKDVAEERNQFRDQGIAYLLRLALPEKSRKSHEELLKFASLYWDSEGLRAARGQQWEDA